MMIHDDGCVIRDRVDDMIRGVRATDYPLINLTTPDSAMKPQNGQTVSHIPCRDFARKFSNSMISLTSTTPPQTMTSRPSLSTSSPFYQRRGRTYYDPASGSDLVAESALFPTFNRNEIMNTAFNVSAAGDSPIRSLGSTAPGVKSPSNSSAPPETNRLGTLINQPYAEDSSGDGLKKPDRYGKNVNISELDMTNILRRENATGNTSLSDCGHFVRPTKSKGAREGIKVIQYDDKTEECEVPKLDRYYLAKWTKGE